MRILGWRAEIHLHEIFGRLARRGHDIDLIASGWPGAAPAAELDGIRIRRCGSRHSFAWRARPAVRAQLGSRGYDVVVEDINKVPLYLCRITDLPFCALVPHLSERPRFSSELAHGSERLGGGEATNGLYRRPHPRESESTRDDRCAWRAGGGHCDYPALSVWYHTDPPRPGGGAAPDVPVCGAFEAVQRMETVLRAMAAARANGAIVLGSRGGRRSPRPRDRAHVRVRMRSASYGFVSDEEKRADAPGMGWGAEAPKRMGNLDVEAAGCGRQRWPRTNPPSGNRYGMETGFWCHGDIPVVQPHLDVAADRGWSPNWGVVPRVAEGAPGQGSLQAIEATRERPRQGGRSVPQGSRPARSQGLSPCSSRRSRRRRVDRRCPPRNCRAGPVLAGSPSGSHHRTRPRAPASPTSHRSTPTLGAFPRNFFTFDCPRRRHEGAGATARCRA